MVLALFRVIPPTLSVNLIYILRGLSSSRFQTLSTRCVSRHQCFRVWGELSFVVLCASKPSFALFLSLSLWISLWGVNIWQYQYCQFMDTEYLFTSVFFNSLHCRLMVFHFRFKNRFKGVKFAFPSKKDRDRRNSPQCPLPFVPIAPLLKSSSFKALGDTESGKLT